MTPVIETKRSDAAKRPPAESVDEAARASHPVEFVVAASLVGPIFALALGRRSRPQSKQGPK